MQKYSSADGLQQKETVPRSFSMKKIATYVKHFQWIHYTVCLHIKMVYVFSDKNAKFKVQINLDSINIDNFLEKPSN